MTRHRPLQHTSMKDCHDTTNDDDDDDHEEEEHDEQEMMPLEVSMDETKGAPHGRPRWRTVVVGGVGTALLLLLFLLSVVQYHRYSNHSSNDLNDDTTTSLFSGGQDNSSSACVKSSSFNCSNSVRIQIASDLHLEFYATADQIPTDIVEPQAPILALLGDVGYALTDQLRHFLLAQSERFERVLFLAGNHEYYNEAGKHYSMTEQNEWIRNVCSERDNLHYFEKGRMELGDNIVLLGTTLWSDIPDEFLTVSERSLNDYHKSYNHRPGETPRLLTALETRALYRENLAWLEAQLQEEPKTKTTTTTPQQQQQRVVVLTHHTPLLTRTSDPKYDGSDLTHCFSSNLTRLLRTPIVTWACGHTHYNFDLWAAGHDDDDKNGKGVRVVSNQRGYKTRPKESYRSDGVVIELAC